MEISSASKHWIEQREYKLANRNSGRCLLIVRGSSSQKKTAGEPAV
jgi:hypothetical protein